MIIRIFLIRYIRMSHNSHSSSPGFIAGVTNPTFEDHSSWWDVLCNISTGKITVSKDIEPAGSSGNGYPDVTEDMALGSLSIGRASSASLAMSRYANTEVSDINTDNEFMNDVGIVRTVFYSLRFD